MATGAEQAAHLMQMLGLTEEELCQILAVEPLELLSDQVGHRSELPILVELLDELGETVSPIVLPRWVRSPGLHGRPIEALLSRDFARFEDALTDLAERGFIMRSGSD
jgi:hypothetical protein